MKKVSLVKAVKTTSYSILKQEKHTDSWSMVSGTDGKNVLKAYFKGKAEGQTEGYYKSGRENEALVNLLQSMALRFLKQKEQILLQLKPDLIQIAFTVCEKVIRKELSQPQVLVQLIDNLMTSISPHLQLETVSVYLSPEDLIMLEKFLGNFSYDKKEIKRLRFLSEASLPRGDFRIETEKGLFNCSIQRELEDLRHLVLQG